jgi:hypothetical protein
MGVQVRYKALRQGFHNSQDNPLTPFAKRNCLAASDSRSQARSFDTTSPSTSVRRKSLPMWR